MSAIYMRCTRCNGHYIAGVVRTTPWPAHLCPDGFKGAMGEMADWKLQPPSAERSAEGASTALKNPFESGGRGSSTDGEQ